MAFKLPRLEREVPITEENRTPSYIFHQWWQTVVTRMETAVNSIVELLARLTDVEELTDLTINEDGTIKTGKVLTTSIVEEGVTKATFVQLAALVTMVPSSETTIYSLSVDKTIATSKIDINCTVRFHSTDDVVGIIYLYRDATLLDTAELTLRGSGSNLKTLVPYTFKDEFSSTGTFVYTLKFEHFPVLTEVVDAEAGSVMNVTEFLR